MKIAILGGTGPMGRGLAASLAEKHEVCIGSRTRAKAMLAAAKIPRVVGNNNEDAARWCNVAIATLPFGNLAVLRDLALHLAGKLVISAVNPLRQESGLLQYGSEGVSAAAQIAVILPNSEVATAFNNIPASYFRSPIKHEVDVLIAADKRKTFDRAAAVVQGIPNLRPLYVGPLSQAESVERLTVLVLNAGALNKRAEYSVKFVP